MNENLDKLFIHPLLALNDQRVWKQIKKSEFVGIENIDEALDYILKELQKSSDQWRLEKHFYIFVFRR